jgi:hypothetical protein
MTSLRTTLVGLALAAPLALMATPASAAPPPTGAGTCPAAFTAYTLPELRVLAVSLGLPESAADNVFASINKNGDAYICGLDLPDVSPQHMPATNFIDNTARGRGR